jgi:3-methyladenine DNA glycosylase AlkD
MDVPVIVARLERSLAKQGTRARAIREKRYLKSELRFLGVTMPVIRREAKAFVRANGALSRAELKSLVDALFETRVHELRSMGIGILELNAERLDIRDANWLVELVRRAPTWAHVDWLAIKVLGPLVARDPSLVKRLERWSRDENFWVRRTALLALHDPLAAGTGDFECFERLAVPLLSEREFFIRKAIGWLLRATAKRTPERTIGFVERYGGRMAGLTFHEATRNLTKTEQTRLRALREKSGAD